jgi:hypothetical protein
MAMGKDVLTFLVPGLEKKNQLVETAVKKKQRRGKRAKRSAWRRRLDNRKVAPCFDEQ